MIARKILNPSFSYFSISISLSLPQTSGRTRGKNDFLNLKKPEEEEEEEEEVGEGESSFLPKGKKSLCLHVSPPFLPSSLLPFTVINIKTFFLF